MNEKSSTATDNVRLVRVVDAGRGQLMRMKPGELNVAEGVIQVSVRAKR